MNFRKMLCAALDHPPVVNACFGEISCARCDEVVGDTLMGSTTLEGLMVVGHECRDCDEARAGLTWRDRLGTTLDRVPFAERQMNALILRSWLRFAAGGVIGILTGALIGWVF